VDGVFATPGKTRDAIDALPASPDHMFFFEYNFLYVLAAGGRPSKSAFGDHTVAGYRQRARFYSISAEARFRYARNVARYLLFLARDTGLAAPDKIEAARAKLEAYPTIEAMLGNISPPSGSSVPP
jgi:hypothetical protein